MIMCLIADVMKDDSVVSLINCWNLSKAIEMYKNVISFGREVISDYNIDFFDVEVNDGDEANNECVIDFFGFLLCFERI